MTTAKTMLWARGNLWDVTVTPSDASSILDDTYRYVMRFEAGARVETCRWSLDLETAMAHSITENEAVCFYIKQLRQSAPDWLSFDARSVMLDSDTVLQLRTLPEAPHERVRHELHEVLNVLALLTHDPERRLPPLQAWPKLKRFVSARARGDLDEFFTVYQSAKLPLSDSAKVSMVAMGVAADRHLAELTRPTSVDQRANNRVLDTERGSPVMRRFRTEQRASVNVASEMPFTAPDGKSQVSLPVRAYMDFESNAKFVSCYIGPGLPVEILCVSLVRQIDKLLELTEGAELTKTHVSGTVPPQYASQMRFTGRFFIYIDQVLDPAVNEKVVAYAQSQGILAHLRDQRYAEEHDKQEKPDAFISHDWADKDDIARPLAEALSKQLIRVWYDEYSLKVGDSLRETIERGLRECKKCVLIVSPRFLANTGWTKREFDAVFTREVLKNQDVVLPVWHNVDVDDVYAYSPTLANRVALKTDEGIEQIAKKLRQALR